MINVLIVDDQNMSRILFETYIQNEEGYNLLYSINSAKMADIYCAKHEVDLVIMDVVMNDGSNGLEAAERIRKNNPDTKIIIVTSMPEVSYLRRAKSIGVNSFWYKEHECQPFMELVRRTMAGESVYPDSTPTLRMGMADSTDFTECELVVLRQMTAGLSNNEIAEKLNVSINTVKQHIAHMLQKTGYKNRTELAIDARVNGLVIAEDDVIWPEDYEK